MGSTLSSAGLGIWALPVQPFSFKWPFSFLRLWPGMRRITIKIPQNRFGIRSTSTSVFTQQSGKPSLILCKRIKWRLSDWFMPAPGWGFLLDQRSKEGCPFTDEASQTPWNQKVTMHVCVCACVHTHTYSLSHISLWRRYCLPETPIYILLGALGKARTCCFLSGRFEYSLCTIK